MEDGVIQSRPEEDTGEFEYLFDALPLGILLVTRDGKIRQASKEARALFGGQLRGRNVDELVPDHVRPHHAALRADFARQPEARRLDRRGRIYGRRLDGTVFPCEVALGPLKNGSVLAAVTDISARVNAEEALKSTIGSLKSSNAELERLAHLVSHDLQEPVRAIKGFSDLLMEDLGPKLDEEHRTWLGYIHEGASRCRAQISSLLSLSRISSDGEPFATTDTQAVVEGVLHDLKELQRDVGGQLIVCGELPEVLGDQAQIRLVFLNLCTNALKYRRQGAPVTVRISAEAGESAVVFKVEDNGRGVRVEDLDVVFELFKRGALVGDVPGSGAGLAICQKIVLRHGGRIWMASDEGRGTIVYFTLRKTGDEASA